MEKISLYHNPRCSKSRQTLQLLQDKNYDIEIIEYLKTPPSISTLSKIIKQLSAHPRDIMRTNEAIYSDLNLKDEAHSNKVLIQALHENPILLQRPIVVYKNKAAIGRPPENVLEILA